MTVAKGGAGGLCIGHQPLSLTHRDFCTVKASACVDLSVLGSRQRVIRGGLSDAVMGGSIAALREAYQNTKVLPVRRERRDFAGG